MLKFWFIHIMNHRTAIRRMKLLYVLYRLIPKTKLLIQKIKIKGKVPIGVYRIFYF